MRFATVAGGPGRGHEMRCRAIGQELERRGWLDCTHSPDVATADPGVVIVDPGRDPIRDIVDMRWCVVGSRAFVCLDSDERGDLNITTGYDMAPIRDEVRAQLVTREWTTVPHVFIARQLDCKLEGLLRTLCGHSVLFLPPEERYAEGMARSKWCITNGGLTMLECMSLGKACWVVPQTKAEWEFAFRAYEQGALLGMGDDVKMPSDRDIRVVGEMAGEMVDGRGAERIVDLIEGEVASG